MAKGEPLLTPAQNAVTAIRNLDLVIPITVAGSTATVSSSQLVPVSSVVGRVLTATSSFPAWSAHPTLGSSTETGSLTLVSSVAGGAGITIQNTSATVAYNFNLPLNAGSTGQLLVPGSSVAPMSWTYDPILGSTAAANTGSLGFVGGSSGVVTIQPSSATNTYTIVFPTTQGSSGQVLINSSASGSTIFTQWASTPGQFRVVTASGDTTGATDHTNIQNALNTGVGTVFLTGVDYYTSSIIDIPDRTNLIGMGMSGTVLHAVSSPSAPIRFNGVTYGSVCNINITGACTRAIWFTGTANNQNLVDRVLIQGTSTVTSTIAPVITTGVEFSGGTLAYQNRVHRTKINNCTTGILLQGDGSALATELISIDIGLGVNGLVANSSLGAFEMTQLSVFEASSHGIVIDHLSAFTAVQCGPDSCGGDAWHITNVSHGGQIVNCWAGASVNQSGYFGQNATLEFTGCEAGDNHLYGFVLAGSSSNINGTQISVTGCAAWGNSAIGSASSVVVPSMYFNNALVNVTGNFSGGPRGGVGGTPSYGYFFDSGTLGVAVANTGAGNGTANINVLSTMINVANMP